jgi:hypothetical protein
LGRCDGSWRRPELHHVTSRGDCAGARELRTLRGQPDLGRDRRRLAAGVNGCVETGQPVQHGVRRLSEREVERSYGIEIVSAFVVSNLQSSIDWQALVADGPRCGRAIEAADSGDGALGDIPRLASACAAHGAGVAEARALLLAACNALSVKDIIDRCKEARMPLPLLAAAYTVGARHDWYVLPHHSRRLHELLSEVAGARSEEQEWLRGGHAHAFLSKGSRQVACVVRAIDAAAATPQTVTGGIHKPKEAAATPT